MRVGIDARNISDPQPGGFKHYAWGLVRGLCELGLADQFVGLLDRPIDLTSLRLSPNVSLKPIAGYHRLWHELWGLGAAMRAEGVDVAHFTTSMAPLRVGLPMVMTVHDTFAIEPPRLIEGDGGPVVKRAWRSPKQRLADAWWRWLCRQGVRQARRILCPSEASRRDIVRVFRAPADRVRAVYHGVDEWFRPLGQGEAACVLGRLELPVGYVLCFGSPDPRKNVPRLLSSYAGLPLALREAHPLAIVISQPRSRPILSALSAREGTEGQVLMVEGVSTADLGAIYSGAAMLAFPSLGEGFGAPPLEAMACGCPVLAGNVTSMPEIAGDAALLVDPRSEPEIRAGLEQLLTDAALRERLRERGIDRARQFPWRNTAEGTVAAYREAAGS